MVWRAEDEQGNEAAKVRWDLVRYTRGFGYDLGCGAHKAFPHFIGVDNKTDERLFGHQMKPDLSLDTCEKLDKFASQSADFIFSSHLLEHIEDHKAALKDWWRVLKVGGHLCLYLPHKNFYPNIGEPGANPDHKHDFVPADIVRAMEGVGGWDLLVNEERGEGTEYSFFQVFKKLAGDKRHYSFMREPPAKTCAVVRYGAFGDLMMASSVLPGLKAQGYHVTLYTVARGYEVVKHDPNIDDVVIQDHNQVPNHLLGEFWAHLAKRYDKVINLSESVEGSLLLLPDRGMLPKWPTALRDRILNHNYLEVQHELAGVPMPAKVRFYATDEEKAWARKSRASLPPDAFVIMWPLAGSSVHKHWPHMDQLLARILITYPEAHLVMVGDESCQIIEAGWENEPRIVRRSGQWSIRQTLAFLAHCDMVIGSETGVLNAAGYLPIPKIVFLSHSSVENLTRDWVNTTSLTPEHTPCYPCHQMHYGFETCNPGYMEVEGQPTRVGSLCAVNITPEKAWAAFQEAMPEEAELKVAYG